MQDPIWRIVGSDFYSMVSPQIPRKKRKCNKCRVEFMSQNGQRICSNCRARMAKQGAMAPIA